METHQHFLSALTLRRSGELLVLSATNGEVLRCRGTDSAAALSTGSSALEPIYTTEVAPIALAADPQSDRLFLTNPSEQCVVQLTPSTTFPLTGSTASGGGGEGEGTTGTAAPARVALAWNRYEGRAFISPTAIAISSVTGDVFFTDAGGEGESTLANPVGAVFRTVHDRSRLVPLSETGLQQPSAIAVGRDGCVYVCEQAANRVLRYVPRGARYVGGVFAQFQGSMGPSAVAISPKDGAVFVALFEPLSLSAKSVYGAAEPQPGLVMVLERDGHERGTITTPSSELRGLAVDGDGAWLYVLAGEQEAAHSVIWRVPLSSS